MLMFFNVNPSAAILNPYLRQTRIKRDGVRIKEGKGREWKEGRLWRGGRKRRKGQGETCSPMPSYRRRGSHFGKGSYS